MSTPKHVLPLIVIAQFCCTSMWFAGNAVMGDLVKQLGADSSLLGHLTSMVQFGFITGTLLFALMTVADRFSPSRVFFYSAVAGALVNLGTILQSNTIITLLAFRFLTGFFLAGIYPVGMKIAADYFEKGLGRSLGYLVGALVLGTAFPHLLKNFTGTLPWKLVLIGTSGLAILGGLLVLLRVPDGPFRKKGQRPDLTAFAKIFRQPAFRSAAFGYFGHMWELYAFWAFVPVMLGTYNNLHPGASFNIPVYAFLVIGAGALACVLAGYIAQQKGTKKTAAIALLTSGLCCVLSPLFFSVGSPFVFIFLLLIWGMAVIADSPLFSTLVAQNAQQEIKGTALTIVNCIGFSITIISIQLLNWLREIISPTSLYLSLALGPALGLWSLWKKPVNGNVKKN